MSWLVLQVWPWMLLAAVLGASTTFALMTTRVTVEKWVEVVVEPEPETVAVRTAAEPAPAVEPDRPAEEAIDSSPFPTLPDAPSERPWEAEELWSRPARLADATGGKPRPRTDEWSEAAVSWRSWAEEAATKEPAVGTAPAAVGDDDLFAADREAERLGLEVGVFPVSLDPRLPDDEDDFPYARPVEASEYAPPVFPGFDGALDPHEERRTA